MFKLFPVAIGIEIGSSSP